MPGTTCATQNATCSVSAKKLSGLRFSTIRPTGTIGTSSSGTIFVASSTSKREALGLFFGEDLQAQLPLGIGAGLDRLPQVAAMEVGVGPGNLDGLVPHQRMGAGLRVPVELDEVRFALVVDQAVGMHAEALHRAIAARNRAIGHRPHQHVGDLGHQRRKVPERVVRRPRLRHGEVRLGLGGVDQVGKLHRVLDEEDRDVVADEIPVAFVRVELHREAAHVSARCRSSRARRGRSRSARRPASVSRLRRRARRA